MLAARVRPSSHRRKSESQESAGAAKGPEEAQVDGARKAGPTAPDPAKEAPPETTGASGGSEPGVAPRMPTAPKVSPWTAAESTQIQTGQTSSPPAAGGGVPSRKPMGESPQRRSTNVAARDLQSNSSKA